MKKKTVLIAGMALFAATLSAAVLAGCGSFKFSQYSFDNTGEVNEEDWRDVEYPDTDMTVDGLVNATEYGTQHLSFSDVNGVNMKVYAHLGEEGVFFGFVSDDHFVNYNPSNVGVYNNTSVEIQVAPSGTETLNSNVVQIRLGANGSSEQWVGFPSDDGNYPYTMKYMPSLGAVHVNGELNSYCEGYSMELYLPYIAMGLSTKPQSVVCAPSFNTMPDPYSSSRATWTMMLGCDLGQPATWYVVDETGMTAHTAGFEKSGATVTQTKGYNEFYYFDSVPSASYYLKTTVRVQPATGAFLNDDGFPKFGLVNKSENALQAFYIDAAGGTGTNFGTVQAIQSTAGGTNWQWDTNASTSIEGHWGNSYIAGSSASYIYRDKVLETIYYEGDLYFVLDGVLVKTVKNFAPSSEGAVPGFMCFNTRAEFKSNEFVTDADKVKTEVEKYLAKHAKIDGDLSDWTNADVNRHARTVEDDANGNKMTIRAFRGSDGLYVAYEVTHKVSLAASKWDEGWWNNTNVELYVNGTAEKNHYALTSFGSGGYMDGVLYTGRNSDRTYTTVAEIFIPMASLVKDGFDENDTLRVGFAFKSTDGTADSNLNGTDWWALEGTPVTRQLSVLAKGIGEEYTITYSSEDEDVTGTAPLDETVFAGDSITLPENPFTKSGYTFAGWSDGVNAYAAGDEFVMPGHDVTFVPCWIANGAEGTYGVVYAPGADDTEGELPVDSNSYAPGALVTLAQATLTREGYRFAGWSDGTTTYAAGSKIFMGGEAITLTAVWQRVYTLSYAKGTGSVEGTLPDEGLYIEGEEIVLKNADLLRSGYEFSGWSYGDDVYAVGDIFVMPAQDVTLTAVWKTKISVDGKLTDWNALGTKTIEAHSVTSGGQKATWYGVLRDDGLYLAVDITHKQIGYGQGDWWRNLNFEIHLGPQNAAHYVYLSNANTVLGAITSWTIGTSSPNMQAAYDHSGGILGASHRSTFEVFFPSSMIAGWMETDGSIRVGVGIKTNDEGEKISGGSYNYADGDPWYAPYGVLVDNYDYFAYVTKDGMYLRNEYLHEDWQFGKASAAADDNSITVDGAVSDWAGSHTIGITGTDMYDGKSVTFYGKLTKTGLYLAVEAYHELYTYGQNDWWNNTNLELRIGEIFGSAGHLRSKQFWVYATAPAGENAFTASDPSYMTVQSKTEQIGGRYHTVIEVLFTFDRLVQYDYMVQNGMIHVGVAWKTNDDKINNGAIGGGTDAWWVPKDTHIETNPACVDVNGIYTAKEYETR